MGSDIDEPPPIPPSLEGEHRSLVGDVREKFAELSRRVSRNVDEERAFILAKIDTVRNDPDMTHEEKELAVAELKKALP